MPPEANRRSKPAEVTRPVSVMELDNLLQKGMNSPSAFAARLKAKSSAQSAEPPSEETVHATASKLFQLECDF